MIIAIGADHGGFDYKQELMSEFESKYDFVDVGAYKLNPDDDYTSVSFEVAKLVAEKKADFGVVICRTGAGACIAMNKVKGIRSAVLENKKSAILAREKNDINTVALGADNISLKRASEIIKICLTTLFEGGRHARRIKDIEKYEKDHISK